ncbi:uncharacterized protein LOC100177508 [Ciona intestinalis]
MRGFWTYIIFGCLAIAGQASQSLQHSEIKPTGIRGTCDKEVIGVLNGRIASPNFPLYNYTLDVTCVYEIVAGPGQVIAYQSLYMDLEGRVDDACYDHVDVFPSGSITGESFDRYCGREVIYPDVTTGSKLAVMFVSDGSVSASGFVISWWILTPGNMRHSLNCNFDDPIPLCAGWSQLTGDTFDWTFFRGPTPSRNTGPTYDHTTGGPYGRYAYIEASDARNRDTAALRTPAITSDQPHCLRFWYHNHGTGELHVIVILDDYHGTVVATYRNNTGPQWLNASLTIRDYNQTIQIVFEAVRGRSFKSDVAIDDVTISQGRCPSEHVCEEGQFTCANPFHDIFNEDADYGQEVGCVRQEFVCDGSDDCFDGSDETNCTDTVRCPSNQLYQACASSCNKTCSAGPEGASCSPVCVSRCACPSHLPFLHNGVCIKYKDCPNAIQGKADSERERANKQITTGFRNLLSLFARWMTTTNGT